MHARAGRPAGPSTGSARPAPVARPQSPRPRRPAGRPPRARASCCSTRRRQVRAKSWRSARSHGSGLVGPPPSGRRGLRRAAEGRQPAGGIGWPRSTRACGGRRPGRGRRPPARSLVGHVLDDDHSRCGHRGPSSPPRPHRSAGRPRPPSPSGRRRPHSRRRPRGRSPQRLGRLALVAPQRRLAVEGGISCPPQWVGWSKAMSQTCINRCGLEALRVLEAGEGVRASGAAGPRAGLTSGPGRCRVGWCGSVRSGLG